MSAFTAQLNQVLAVVAQLDTTEVTDSGSTRTVLAITVFLLLAAIVLAGITVRYWKNTVPDPEALASLADLSESRTRPWWKRRRNSVSE